LSKKQNPCVGLDHCRSDIWSVQFAEMSTQNVSELGLANHSKFIILNFQSTHHPVSEMNDGES